MGDREGQNMKEERRLFFKETREKERDGEISLLENEEHFLQHSYRKERNNT